MSSLRTGFSAPSATSCLAAGLCVVLSVWLGGCPVPDPNGNGNTNTNTNDNSTGGQLNATILNITTSFGVSVQEDAPLTVLYTVTGSPDSVLGYYVPVADSSADAGKIGDRVVIDSSLLVGEGQAFSFDPVASGTGFYRVGVVATDGAETAEDESDGVIQVQGPPDPVFVQPSQVVTEAVAGDGILVSFDAGDPEGDAQWRVFYFSDGDDRTLSADRLGKLLATGSGNIGQVTFDTSGLLPGDYELGLSAVDSGRSIAGAVSAGEEDRIITIPSDANAGPIVRITQ